MYDNTAIIMEGAGPFYFKGNKIGMLMIHGGGGGTCADLKPLAEDLHELKGYTIHVPLLPGYGTSPQNLKETDISDWKNALEKEIVLLQDKCNKVFIGGHSMGALLSLILASIYNFDGVFTICAPVGINRFGYKLVPFFKLFLKYYPVNSEKFKNETNGAWIGYNKIPLNIATKVKKLIKEMIGCLDKISCPVIFFQGCLDSEVNRDSMDIISKNINSTVKKKIWLKNNAHPILNSPDHQQIVLELIEFIGQVCN
ncbi:MAG: alpha/beta hydrolase [Promethearchaeota archaeon]